MSHLAIDLDDVLLNFVGRLVEAVNEEYGTDLTREDINDWNISQFLDPILKEDWWGWWERRAWLWGTAGHVQGAIGALEKLRLDGHLLEIITATPRWAESQRWRWMEKWKPPVHRLTMGPARPAMVKHEWTTATILVDDKPSNVREWESVGREGILFTRPHNWRERGGFQHVADGWGEAYDLITLLSEREIA